MLYNSARVLYVALQYVIAIIPALLQKNIIFRAKVNLVYSFYNVDL